MLPAMLRAIVRVITRNPYIRIRVADNGSRRARSQAIYVYIGRGAGYVRGATLWIGRGVRGGTDASVDAYRGRWSVGCTANANRVPWTAH